MWHAGWPASREQLIELQQVLAAADPEPWRLSDEAVAIGGCFVCFERGRSGLGTPGDRGWAGAALVIAGHLKATATIEGKAGAAYEAGLLAMREGALLEAAVRSLPRLPDVLLVNATGRDHPRRAGLALHLGAVLGIPTVGVTHRPLCASGDHPAPSPGATAPLWLGRDIVGLWLRTRAGTRPLAIHPGWRTDARAAVEVVLAAAHGARTPEPLVEARRAARTARARATEVLPGHHRAAQ